MTYRALFLDDMQTRHDRFKYVYDDLLDITYVYTYEAALAYIEHEPRYDVWLLDHDLSEEDILVTPGEPSRVETGSDLTKELVDSYPAEVFPDIIVIHSHNPPGAQWMENYFRYRKLRDDKLKGLQIVVKPFFELSKGKLFK